MGKKLVVNKPAYDIPVKKKTKSTGKGKKKKLPVKRNSDPKGTTKSPKGLSWIPAFRSNIHSIWAMVTELNLRQTHIDMLKESPFFYMFNAIYLNKDVNHRKVDSTIEDILSCYDPRERKFKLGTKFVDVTAADISVIFGIKCGKKVMDMKLRRDPLMFSFVKRRFPDCSNKVNVKLVKQVLKEIVRSDDEDDVKDVVRLLILASMGSLFFSSKGEHISSTFLYYVEDLEKMKEYDWATAIREHLMQSVVEKHATPLLVIGCVSLLPYWFNEHTMIFKPSRDILPRFMKWDVSKRIDKFMELIAKLENNQVIAEDLVLTSEEKLMFSDDMEEKNSMMMVRNENESEEEMKINNVDEENTTCFENEPMGPNFSTPSFVHHLSSCLQMSSNRKDASTQTTDDVYDKQEEKKDDASVEAGVEDVVRMVNEQLMKEKDELIAKIESLTRKKEELTELKAENYDLMKEKVQLLAQIEDLKKKNDEVILKGHIILASEVEITKRFEEKLKEADAQIHARDLKLKAKEEEIKNLRTVNGEAVKRLEEKVEKLTKENETQTKIIEQNEATIQELLGHATLKNDQ